MLQHRDIQDHIGSFMRLMELEGDRLENKMFQLGEWVFEKLMEQENLEP